MQAIACRCEHCEHTFPAKFNLKVSDPITGSIMGANTPCSASAHLMLAYRHLAWQVVLSHLLAEIKWLSAASCVPFCPTDNAYFDHSAHDHINHASRSRLPKSLITWTPSIQVL